MDDFFFGETTFNGDISRWDVSSMLLMFYSTTLFNQDIGGWDVSSVTDMREMFKQATAFNADISGWNTSSVTTMEGMFRGATSFNQDIGGWDVSSVLFMSAMFNGAESFNHPLDCWNDDLVIASAFFMMFLDATGFLDAFERADGSRGGKNPPTLRRAAVCRLRRTARSARVAPRWRYSDYKNLTIVTMKITSTDNLVLKLSSSKTNDRPGGVGGVVELLTMKPLKQGSESSPGVQLPSHVAIASSPLCPSDRH